MSIIGWVLAALGLCLLIAGIHGLTQENRRRELSVRFGPEIAQLIMARLIRQGMTEEMVIEAWGRPADIDKEVLKKKTKETWKYNQTGVNRFRDRILIEDGIVVGWKNQ